MSTAAAKFAGLVTCPAVTTGDVVMTGTMKSALTGTANPEAYGAIGDGLTDDTSAIQACITANSNIVFGVNKTYRITATLNVTSNKTIDLNGSTITNNDGASLSTDVSHWLNTTTGAYLNATALAWGMFLIQGTSVGGCDNITIKNGSIIQGTIAVHVIDARNVLVDNLFISCCGNGVTILNNFVAGGGIADMGRISITNCKMSNLRGTPIGCNGPSTSQFIDGLVVENCQLWNWGANGIGISCLRNARFTKVSLTYDKTYNSWPVGSNGAGELAKPYISQGGFTYGDPAANTHVNEYLYLYYMDNCTFDNCILWSDWTNPVWSKVTSGVTNTTFNRCKFEGLYTPLPNTGPVSGSYSLAANFNDCEIGWIQSGALGDLCTWQYIFTRCIISSIQLTSASPQVAAGFWQFRDCKFQVDPTNTPILALSYDFRVNGNFGGRVEFDNCDFYPNTTGSNVWRTSFKPSVSPSDFSGLYMRLTKCRFNGGGNTTYAIETTNDGTTFTATLGQFLIDGCMSTNCLAFNNYNVTNIEARNCKWAYGTVNDGVKLGNVSMLSCTVDTADSTRFNPPITVGVRAVSTHQASIGGDAIYDGKVHVTSAAPLNTTWYATYRDSIDANYSATGAVSGTVVSGIARVADGYLHFENTVAKLRYAITSAIDNGGYLGIRFHVVPLYSGSPTVADTAFVSMGTSGLWPNTIEIYHRTTGTLFLQCTNSTTGSSIISVDLGAWNPTAGQEYELELDLDVVNGTTRFFVNGVQLGATISSTGTRTAATQLQVGSTVQHGGESAQRYLLRNLVVTSVPMHTTTYTPGVMLPSNPGSLEIDGT
ncbi:MAG: hypothetical protein P4L69_19870, partial [Desulfosporosinus sp.]|nr:hypothetical protein [Desulfosporosinus sp.]